MRIKAIPNERLRKLALPLGASVIAAAGTMFVPTPVLETITGSTGLSELVPATAAPLGDTARALIAFGAGAFTLAVASLVMFRSSDAALRTAAPAPEVDNRMEDMQTKPSFADRIGSFRMPHIKLPKMPWIKGEGDVTELSDLPRIRTADAHPDAPSRRPLVATQDLPTLDLTNVQTGPVVVGEAPLVAAQPEPVPAIDPAKWYGEIAASTVPAPLPPAFGPLPEGAPLPGAESLPVPVVAEAPAAKPVEAPAEAAAEPAMPAPAAATPAAQPMAAQASQPSLDDMLAQFEASIARRQAQFVTPAVEAVPVDAPLAASSETVSDVVEPVQADILPPIDTATEPESPPARFAIPLSPISKPNKTADEMDSALAAALATLQRMNGTAR